MSERKIGILASGRGSNLQAILDSIATGELKVKVAVVISDKSEAYALQRAEQLGIANFVVERKQYQDPKAFEERINSLLIEHEVELVVLAGFMRILSSHFVEKWKLSIINIHPALLPSFPGVNAQEQALAYGVKTSGCTVHFVDEGMDTGPIILQRTVPVFAHDDLPALAARILIEEHQALPAAIKLWATDKLRVEGRKVRILE
ncbi:MAG TPA: phosphoribosylglycinamide formyltransferase [Candidatus Avacidaminococcus intestinavium]|uniref:Phosphoribosylglycinamide formyltransferase n=1 Tax=Candidatus Avacidaminococcus intestinavium TaxID=2840684 RepID=A0A9D1SK99_9FIRM|nr:phosphoribosylglycinamide formyltransferase [Candidatus Avacidaminococcus intestinavium]